MALALVCGLLAGEALGGATGIWGGGAVAAGAGAWLVSGRRRSALALLAIALVGGCRFVEAERRAERRVRALRATAGGLQTDFVGRVLRAAEPAGEGEHVLWMRGRPRQPGEPPGPELTVRLRVRRSAAEPTRRLLALRRGDGVRVWCRLRLPRRLLNPGAPDPLRGLRATGADALGSVKTAWLLSPTGRGRPGPARLVDGVRVGLRRRLDRTLEDSPAAARAVASAMMLGERGRLTPEVWRLFRDAGLAHLLAISGLHVGLLGALLVGSLRRAGLRPRGTLVAGGALLAALCFGVGAGSPVTRATGTAVLMLAGRAVGRDGEALNALALVAAVLMLDRPWSIWTPGFQLTFVAAGGILLLAPRVAETLPGPRWASNGPAVSIAAYLVTAPIVACHFQHLAPVGLLSNLLAVPLCALTLLGTLTGALLVDLPVVGPLAVGLARTGPDLLLGLARGTANLPGLSGLPVAPPRGWLWVALGVATIALARASRAGRVAFVARRALLLGLLLLHLGPLPAGFGSFRVVVPDVGQGQAVLLRGPSGGFVVIDAGGSAGGRFDAGERVVGPLLRRLGCRRIERLIVTHHHDDHAGGARALVREFEVGELMLGAGASREPGMGELVDAALRRGAAVVLAERGEGTRRAGIPLRVLHPPRHRRDPPLGANDRSVVVLAGRAPHRLLVPGDLEGAGEAVLLAGEPRPRAEALVVGHHGGRGGSGERWLRAVSPRVALISAGRSNRFGHPSPAVLGRLRGRGVEIRRTDLEGMLRLEAGERGWSVSALRPASDVADVKHRERDERCEEDEQQQHGDPEPDDPERAGLDP